MIADTAPPPRIRLHYHKFVGGDRRTGHACRVTATDGTTGRTVARGDLPAIAGWLERHEFRADPTDGGLFRRAAP